MPTTLDHDGLDERDCRRPTWRAGTPIRLANGQAWHLAPLASSAVLVLDESSLPVARLPWEGDLFLRVSAYYHSLPIDGRKATPEGADRFLAALGALAMHLLIENYRLAPDEAAALLDGVPPGTIAGHFTDAAALLAEAIDNPGGMLPSN